MYPALSSFALTNRIKSRLNIKVYGLRDHNANLFFDIPNGIRFFTLFARTWKREHEKSKSYRVKITGANIKSVDYSLQFAENLSFLFPKFIQDQGLHGRNLWSWRCYKWCYRWCRLALFSVLSQIWCHLAFVVRNHYGYWINEERMPDDSDGITGYYLINESSKQREALAVEIHLICLLFQADGNG